MPVKSDTTKQIKAIQQALPAQEGTGARQYGTPFSRPQISPLNMPIHKDSDINGTQNTKQAAIVFQLIGVAPPNVPMPPAHPLRGRVLLGLRMA